MNTIERIKEAAHDSKCEFIGSYEENGIKKYAFFGINRGRTVAFRGIAEQIMISFRADNMSLIHKDTTIVVISEVQK